MCGSAAVLPANGAGPARGQVQVRTAPGTVGRDECADRRRMGFGRHPDRAAGTRQHREFTEMLGAPGVEVIELGEGMGGGGGFALTPDAFYRHDASFPSPRGMILLRPGKRSRRGEPEAPRAVFAARGVPVVGAIPALGVAEGGAPVRRDGRTRLAGEGCRTDADGIAQLAGRAAPDSVEAVPAPLPHGEGPARCFRLRSLPTDLDSRTIPADPELLALATLRRLTGHGFDRIPIVAEEHGTTAAKVLSSGNGELLTLRTNRRTNGRIEAAGCRVRPYAGSEIRRNGSGGPTGLARPRRPETP